MSYVPTIVQAIEPNSDDVDLFLSQQHIRKLNLSKNTFSVQFGSKVANARVCGMERSGLTLIRSSLARSLHLPSGVPLLMRHNASEQRLVFGPLIGILISHYNAQVPSNPFGTLTPFFNEITDICRRRGGIACTFKLKDVNWDTQTVRALIRRNNSWHIATLPLPQCIYNRFTSRQRERSEEVSTWIQRCKDAQIPFFNENFLNKWHVQTALAKEAGAQAHLPRTIRYQSQQDLKQMLQEHRCVYVKPTSGSMGRGIYRIRSSGSRYQLSRVGAASKVFSDLASLNLHVSKRLKGKSYLIQQGLSLIGIQQRPTDFRVLVQKNRIGEWAVTSMVARLGQNNIVSNVARGGTMLSPMQALRICGPWQGGQRPTPVVLRHTALKLARLLEQSLAGHYAEFGVDLGVDVQGRIWLLEVNSKPSKATNTVPVPANAEQKRPRPSVYRMLDYAAYLSGYPVKNKISKSKKVTRVKKKGRR